MISNKPRFFVYGVTAEAWTKRYGVQAFSHPCSDCGRTCTTTIPFVQGTLRGLASPPCVCGNVSTPYGMVRDPRYGDLLSGTEEVGTRPKASRRKLVPE